MLYTRCLLWHVICNDQRWFRKDEKMYLLGYLLPAFSHWSMFFTIANWPSIACELCHPVPLDAEHSVQAPMFCNEVFHSNLKVEGKGKNSRYAAGLLRCVDTHRGNDWLGLWTSLVAVWSWKLEDHGNLKKMPFCLIHQVWQSVSLEFYLWSLG